jgi:hypothetical protein
MSRIWLNSKIIKPESNKVHSVEYYIYHEEGDDIQLSKDPKKDFVNVHKNSNTICFAGLLEDIKDHSKNKDKINRIMYCIQDESYKDKLDDQEIVDWITIAKQGHVLPNYVNEEMVLKKIPVIKLIDISPSLLYIYLSALRVIQENQSFVRAMLYLVAVYRINFSAAWALASRLVIANSWHNIVELGRKYGQKNEDDVNNIDVPLGLIIGMNRYLKEPEKYDKRTLSSKDEDSYYYGVHSIISNLCAIERDVIAGDLFQDPIIDAINSNNDEDASKNLKRFKASTPV